jgi:hypothetical protein
MKGEAPMSKDTSASTPVLPSKRRSFSLGTWALIVGMLLALAVKFDVFKNIPW